MRKEGKGEEETETQKVGGVPERKQSRGSAAAQTQTPTAVSRRFKNAPT